jgi:NAD(P)-dependent dehydrogenase (short-subunit alcohol dehydrogenase family)
MTGRLESKVIIVTGGSAGMGRALALRAAAEGAKVVVAARDKKRGEAVVQEIETAGGEALFVSTDVTVEEDLATLVDTTTRQFGRLDGAFDNAGGGDTMSSVRTMDDATWRAPSSRT